MNKVPITQIRAMLKEILAASGVSQADANNISTIQLAYMLEFNQFSYFNELEDLLPPLQQSKITFAVRYLHKAESDLSAYGHTVVDVPSDDWQRFEDLYTHRVTLTLFGK